MNMKNDALEIIRYAIRRADPYEASVRALKAADTGTGTLTVFSIGKAAVPMAQAAADVFGSRIGTGLCVTKYGHTGDFSSEYFEVIEASHPISDDNSVLAAEKALAIAEKLTENDVCVILLSGGGSALFEKSRTDAEKQREISKKLLARGAGIDEINAIRRRLSLVKGGRFAAACYPARVVTFALSDVLSNDKSVIASGISVPDLTDNAYVKAAAEKYLYDEDESVLSLLYDNEALTIRDGGYYFVGDINSLCDAAKEKAEELGYRAEIVSRALTGEARDKAGELIASHAGSPAGSAFIYGGETTVTLKGKGLGGRNQEMALTAAIELKDSADTLFASVGSDGTDGPTDAAGGIADGHTYTAMLNAGVFPETALEDNDSYHALKAADALVVTGPTGTNVNDLTVILREKV